MVIRVIAEILNGEVFCGYARRGNSNEIELFPSIEYSDETEFEEVRWDELLQRDTSLAQLQDLPEMSAAWRWEEGAEFQIGRLPDGGTFYFRCEARLGPEYPDRNQYHESVIVEAWVRVPTQDEAETIFRRQLDDSHLVEERCDVPLPTTFEDYDDDPERLAYFEQAQTDGEVLLVNTCPRFPCLWINASVLDAATERVLDAHYFLAGTELETEATRLFDPDFWQGEYRTTALKVFREAVSEAGFGVREVLQIMPCSPTDIPENLVAYYEVAEDEGECLAIEQP